MQALALVGSRAEVLAGAMARLAEVRLASARQVSVHFLEWRCDEAVLLAAHPLMLDYEGMTVERVLFVLTGQRLR